MDGLTNGLAVGAVAAEYGVGACIGDTGGTFEVSLYCGVCSASCVLDKSCDTVDAVELNTLGDCCCCCWVGTEVTLVEAAVLAGVPNAVFH